MAPRTLLLLVVLMHCGDKCCTPLEDLSEHCDEAVTRLVELARLCIFIGKKSCPLPVGQCEGPTTASGLPICSELMSLV